MNNNYCYYNTKLKTQFFSGIMADIVNKVNEFIKNKKVVNIQYQKCLNTLDKVENTVFIIYEVD